MKQEKEQHNISYLTDFETFEKHLNGASAAPVHAIRKTAITRFADLGFPTTRQEEWRYTNVAPIARAHFAPVLANGSDLADVDARDVAAFSFAGPQACRLVFINGLFHRKLSSVPVLPEGMVVQSLAAALHNDGDTISRFLTTPYHDNAFTALNTALFQDGVFVQISDNVTLKEPLYIVFMTTGEGTSLAAHPRNIILVGKNSNISLVESYVGSTGTSYLVNTITEIVTGENSRVEHIKLQNEDEHAFHIGTMDVRLGTNSNFTAHTVSVGGAIVRNNVNVLLDAEGIECTLNGLSLARGDQLMDNHTTIDHAKPHCSSHELYKSILNGKARGVFNGKIFVRQDAQKTDAKQTNKTLLLSDEATIDTKPQLEIFADDVKCTHGATVGQLDEEQVFYLRSRGIGTDDARDMLTYAFASDVIHRVSFEPMRDYLGRLLRERLKRGRDTKRN